MALLEIRDLAKSFGGIHAVDGCTFDVEENSITALIGPNGAGKTTVFNIINGLHTPDSGTIRFKGRNIEKLQPHQITRRGISRTFQISRQLNELTVLENLVVQSPAAKFWDLFKDSIHGDERDRGMELLEFVGIAELADQPAAKLSYGQKKLMDLAAALMANPSIILLDEPAGGINPALLDLIIDRVQTLRQQGVTFLIVEHNMDVVMNICDPVVVMAYGKVLAQGSPADIQANDAVLEAYLGVGVMALLEVSDIVAGYGIGPDILTGLSLKIDADKSYCIVGPNGAGKSTLLKVICGLLPPRQGKVVFEGNELNGLRTDQVLHRGICFVPQDRSLFPDMTIKENLRMGGYILNDRREVDGRIDGVYDMFPILKERNSQLAKTLSGGQQQMLLLGRAMVLRPKVIMLDEPSLGLAPIVSRQIFNSMNQLKAAGITIIVVEQNARMGLKFSDWGCVLDLGKTMFEGPSQSILDDPRIEELYLGRRRSRTGTDG